MKKIFFDIETLPAAEEKRKIIEELYGRYVEKREKKGGRAPKDFEEYFKNTSFSGTFGRIFCISYAINNDPPQCLSGDEKEILKSFWEAARDVDLFVGHNIFDFDMKFIYQRSIVLGVRPTYNLTFAKYRDNPMYDTMHEWNKWAYDKTGSSLHELASSFGIKSSKEGDLDGSKVYEFYKAGKLKEICDYCNADVEVTRAIYKRMTFNN
ncbi:hypothetical protein C4553_00370 [Candidatus Parcubacteria bacterium]|nr:MAG: hypothetical protein C4553_00370 [Candidatus Parcubacteria bacterium]